LLCSFADAVGDVLVIAEAGSKEATQIAELTGGVDVIKSRHIEWLRQDIGFKIWGGREVHSFGFQFLESIVSLSCASMYQQTKAGKVRVWVGGSSDVILEAVKNESPIVSKKRFGEI
jgi:hypothetical protein